MKKSVAVWAMALAAAWLGLAAGEVRAEFAWGESAWVSAGRVDCRGDFGGRLVHGTERMGNPDGGAASAWNTTKLADGWQTVTKGTNTAEVAVLNKGTAAIEYGRLSGNASWGSGKVHVVRDWVAVPSGVTLEIGAGTVVKFTRGSGIAVERGGTLRLAGTADAPVRLTAAEDDTEGGDTDMR
ncbi:MAG: hypothetical protein IKO01_09505, partial [Kiritimatiellae bacterium]|nr:hypothetical protein [Kiritimatiellia bacterium]